MKQATAEKPTVSLKELALEPSNQNPRLHRGVRFSNATDKTRGSAIVADQHELSDSGGYSIGNLKDRLKSSVEAAVNILAGRPGPDGEPSFEHCPAFPVDGNGVPVKVSIIIKVE